MRNYLRHELEAAYDLLEHYQCDVEAIAEYVKHRDFVKLKNRAFPMLVAKLPGDLKGQPGDVLSILSWSVAVECGLLDRQLKRDIKATAERKGSHALVGLSDADSLLFYEKDPTPEAEDAFERYVRARWPMIVFSLDPFVDQQNIADAYSLRRDLQLALAFSFATGKISFSQLYQFNRKIEQDSETIALNRTVTAFSHGDETFGWRFYPRFQNPPPERSNFQVLGNMLIRGGPGRNYQMNNSKLESGMRELTAVIIMPSFLERVRFDVTGNWFPLHDPDEMEVPTSRMIEQGRQVLELRRSLETPEICEHYRSDDLDRLKVRVDQLEAMLPMQTRRVQVPYENALGGFQLFTPGSTALVPEVTGFEGVDTVEEGKATDIMIFGRHFSLHETKVVVGGKVLVPDDAIPATTKSLGSTQVDIVSREVVHLKLPADVRPTLIRNVADNELAKAGKLKPTPYVELFLATPTGLSNRLLIPYKPKDPPSSASAEPSGTIEAGYVLLDDTLKIQGSITPSHPITSQKAAAADSKVTFNQAIVLNQTSTVDPQSGAKQPSAGKELQPVHPGDGTEKAKTFTVTPLSYASWEKIRIMSTQPPASDADTIDVEFRFPVERDVYISVKASDVAYKDGSYLIPADSLTKLAGDFLRKLDAYGKLVGKEGTTEVVSKWVLITPKGPDKPPKATHNSLKVSILLFTEPAPPVPKDPKNTATPTVGSGMKPDGTAAGGGEIDGQTSHRPGAPSTKPDPALARMSHESWAPSPEPATFRSVERLPAPAPATSSVATRPCAVTPKFGQSASPVAQRPPSNPRATRPAATKTQTAAAPLAAPDSTPPPRRSILSRIMGKP